MDEKPYIYKTKDIERFIKDGFSLEEVSWKNGKFFEAKLAKRNLSFADLRNADLRDANLDEAILKNADLTGANLTGATLIRANLESAKLDNAILERARLNRANLSFTSFENASLLGAHLRHVNVDHANFKGAILRDAYLDGMYNIQTARFDLADLRNARVRYTEFDTAELKRVKATYGSKCPEFGWGINLFSFSKTSWTEFMPHTSFAWLLRGIKMFFHILFWPVRLILNQIASKGT